MLAHYIKGGGCTVNSYFTYILYDLFIYFTSYSAKVENIDFFCG